jgi:hypothetical protein
MIVLCRYELSSDTEELVSTSMDDILLGT